METLQYKIIKTEKQYLEYCNRLEELVVQESSDPEVEEEIDLLTLLVEKWDEEHDSLGKSDPVEVLKWQSINSSPKN
jgi:HTH-type transcriptional regulator/antitoxin HigA